MKKIYLFILVLFLFIQANGAPIDTTTAKQVAKNFYNSKFSVTQTNTEAINLVYQAISKQKDKIVFFYIFNIEKKGFVIVSGDNLVKPILGYSYESLFNPNNIPPATALWLKNYEKEIAYIIENNTASKEVIENDWERLISANIVSPKGTTGSGTPLITTKWGQGNPYNSLCPYDTNLKARCVTGCVIVAMAQIMNYWQYPSKGMGKNSYVDNPYGILSANFENTTYLYDSMPDKLSTLSTSKQIFEIANLMFHCGVGVEVNYGVTGSDASLIEYNIGSPSAEYALKTYFGYPNIIAANRAIYSDLQWITILKNEIDSNRPILYRGTGDVGGHAFVFDGYDDNDYFHINWGWTGALDGYFLVSALSPGPYSFPNGHYALINVKPANNIIIPDSNHIVYITPTAAGNNDGSSWNNASSDLAFALKRPYATPTQIWVKKGIYYGDTNNDVAFQTTNNSIVYGGFEGNEPADFDVNLRNLMLNNSILDGQNKQRVLNMLSNPDSNTTICDGFIIQNGHTEKEGAGVYMNGGKLINCIIRNNTSDSSYGGGIFIVKNSKNSLIVNCNIYNNKATFGGGIITWGKVNLINCNIVNNTASENGGGIYNSDTCSITNCIVWGNKKSTNSNQINYNSFTLTNVSYSAIEGGFTGVNNINLAANNDGSSSLFYVRFNNPNSNDYTLLAHSACVDKGNSNAAFINAIDLAGLRRIKNGTIDIGAYEQGCYVNNFLEDTVCEGANYQSYGFNYTPKEGGIISLIQKKTTYNDCDSIITLKLHILTSNTFEIADGLCLGKKYTKHGFDTVITTKGTVTLTKKLVNQYGCDSSIIVNLYVTDVDSTFISDNICKGNTYNKNGFHINTDSLNTGISQFSFRTFSSYGCDSVVVLTLYVSNKDSIYIQDAICYGNIYNKNGFIVNTNFVGLGTYQTSRLYFNQYDCDSVVFLNLHIYPNSDTTIYDAVTQGEIYNKHGFIINTDTINTQLYKTQRIALNQYNCDSSIHLHLSVIVGIRDNVNNNNTISIYPSPATSHINISIKNMNSKNYEATLYDLAGKILLQQPINETTTRIDLKSIKKGFYFLQIKEDNKIYHSLKIIKE